MNFRDEYKKSAESLSPDKKAIDRMKAAVMVQINETSPEQPKKKPLPLKRIAYIGGAAAACAIITVSAVTFIPMMRDKNDMVSESSSAEITYSESTASMVIANSSANDAPALEAADTIPESTIWQDEITADCDDDAVSDSSDSSAPENTNDALSSDRSDPSSNDLTADNSDKSQEYSPQAPTVTDEPEMMEETMEADEPEWTDGTQSPSENTSATEEAANDSGDDGNPNTGAPLTMEAVTGEAGTFDECDDYTGEAACSTEEYEYDFTDDESEEAPDYDYRLVLTGNGWLTFKGVRFNQQENAADPDLFEQTLPAYNASDGQYYAVYIYDNVLYLYQNDGKFLGAFVQKI